MLVVTGAKKAKIKFMLKSWSNSKPGCANASISEDRCPARLYTLGTQKKKQKTILFKKNKRKKNTQYFRKNI